MRALRDDGSARVNDVTISRPALNHQDLELNKQPLLVMESMLGECAIRSAMEIKAGSEHTYYIATDDGRFSRFIARLNKTERSVSVKVEASNYPLNQLRELTFKADCVNGPQRACVRLDFGQTEPTSLEITAGPAEAKALQDFVGILCVLTGRGTNQQGREEGR